MVLTLMGVGYKVYFRIYLEIWDAFKIPKGGVITHLTNMQSELSYIAQGY